MRKSLVVFAHPNPKSFCGAILSAYVSALKKNGHEPIVRDLYALRFNPILSLDELAALHGGATSPSYNNDDVKREQQLVRESSAISFIYPVWQGGPPAIMKGYWDRVFAVHFAYEEGKFGLRGLLKGRKAALFRTQGGDEAMTKEKMWPAMDATSNDQMRKFGLEVVSSIYFPKVTRAKKDELEGYLSRVAKAAYDLTTQI